MDNLTTEKPRLVIIGGGAAGFFAAITAAEKNPNLEVIIIEKGKDTLQKVRISGGGRCNLTHACFVPRDLVKFYPRGNKELLGPFHKFSTGDTIDWFDKRGVKTKIEDDGRVFPVSDDSQTIINCLWKAVKTAKVQIYTSQKLVNIQPPTAENPRYKLSFAQHSPIETDYLLLTTGSSAAIWDMLQSIDYQIIEPVPSLFTFNIKDERLKDLAGVAVPQAQVMVKSQKLSAEGSLLVTHWGLSAFAVLRLSAWGARVLHELDYKFEVVCNWTGFEKVQEVIDFLNEFKQENPRKHIQNYPQYGLPARLWERLVAAAGIAPELNAADISKKQIQNLAAQLCQCTFAVNGKSTFKDEFVTSGGVALNQVDFSCFESRLHKNLFFAGEILDIDALTGGFNFQAAWTGGFLAGTEIANRAKS